MSGGLSESPSLRAASTPSYQADSYQPHDPTLVDPLDTSERPTNEMNVESDAIFAWRDRQSKKQQSKNKDQRQANPSAFAPPPPYIFSASKDDAPVASPQPAAQPLATPNIQGILDTIRHRRRSSAASMRSDAWRHDQSALDTASLASEEIHEPNDEELTPYSYASQPSNLHPFDDQNSGVPRLNHISPSPVNLPPLIETDHAEGPASQEEKGMQAPRIPLKGMRRRSSGGDSDSGKVDSLGSSPSVGLAPARPFLTALSPLQSFSPLHPPADTSSDASRSRSHSRTPSWQSASGLSASAVATSTNNSPNASPVAMRSATAGGPRSAPVVEGANAEEGGPDGPGLKRSRSNASTVSRSLSRRQSFAASRASMTDIRPPSEKNHGQVPFSQHRGGLISKLLIVKAPAKDTQGEKDLTTEKPSGNRHRARSSGSMTSFGSMSGPAALTPSSPGPAQLPLPSSGVASIPIRGISGARGSASTAASPGVFSGTPGSRTSLLFDRSYADQKAAPSNIHEQKMLNPEQIVEFAESLKSPVLRSEDEEGFSSSIPGSVRGRLSRSSSGRRHLKRSGSGASLNRGSFNRDKFANDMSFTSPEDERRASAPARSQTEPMELEPVEYVEMGDDVYLPYVDRATEVAELLNHPSNHDLVDFLSSAFPTQSSADPNDPNGWRRVRPEEWTWQEFKNGHLMANRAECDDFDWIRKARQAIRARSEALWERVGLLLGVDPEMINMGEEYDEVFAPGGALGDVFDSDATTPSMGVASPAMYSVHDDRFGFIGDEQARDQVWVEGLQAVSSSPSETDNEDDAPAGAFGNRKARPAANASPGLQLSGAGSEPRSLSPLPGLPGMDTIGESEDEPAQPGGQSRSATMTTAQRAAEEPVQDPFGRTPPTPALFAGGSSLPRSLPGIQKPRTKSFVGLQICTMPSLPTKLPNEYYRRDGDHSGFQQADANMPHLERGPGNPLFPASFSSLSLAPTLPSNNPALRRSSSMAQGHAAASSGSGSQASTPKTGVGRPPWTELMRRKSRGGMSESALTLTSEDDPHGNL